MSKELNIIINIDTIYGNYTFLAENLKIITVWYRENL